MPTEEEERKAKAERAKKLLAQRQKKSKAAASSAASTPATATSSPILPDQDAGSASARTSMTIDDRTELAPPPKGEARRKKAVKEEAEAATPEEKQVAEDSSRAEQSMPIPAKAEQESSVPSQPEGQPGAPAAQAVQPDDPPKSASNLQQTVSLLLAERADLQSQLSARDAEIAASKADKQLLEEGRAITATLEAEKLELQARVSGLEKETEAASKTAEELGTARKDAESAKQRQQELEQAIKEAESQRTADEAKREEAVAGLERNLERAREREGGLEKEVARLRQREVELKATSDNTSSEAEALTAELAAVKSQLDEMRSIRDKLRNDHETLSTDHTSLQQSHSSLSTDLEQVRAEHATQRIQLETVESFLGSSRTDLERANANLSAERKRAESAEKKREALQADNANLLRQLEEVRGKVSTVMEEKAELAEQLDTAKGQLRKAEVDQTVRKLEEELAASASRVQALTRQLADMQAAFTNLQRERDLAAGYSGSPNRTETPPLARTSHANRTVDAILPASVRHKRQVSLTALKARMGPSFTRGGLDSVAETAGERQQFGDEIMFCCPADRADSPLMTANPVPPRVSSPSPCFMIPFPGPVKAHPLPKCILQITQFPSFASYLDLTLFTSILIMLAIVLLSLLHFVRAEPFWVVQLGHLLSTRMDPVVSPGGVSGHVHEIVGASAFSPTYDYATLQASKCTTANVAIDKSNYWVPQLYRKTSSGLQLVPNSYTNVYYFVRRQPNEVVYEFPPGFRMLAGDMDRTTFDASDRAQDAIRYACLNFKVDPEPETNDFPTHSCPDGLRAEVYFPSCWDGVNLWLEGSKHVSYQTEGNFDGHGKCPSTHPHRIVSIFYEFHFKDDFAYEANARELPPDPADVGVWSHGDQTGYGLHGDFTNGWPEGQFQKIFDEGEACNVEFDLKLCPALKPYLQGTIGCSPEKLVVDETIDAVSKLPGNNPLYGSGGPKRSAYTETAKFKAFGPAVPSNWKNLGCIKEPTSGRALTSASEATDDMTPTKCISFCSGKGYKLAGIEYGRGEYENDRAEAECYCGNSLTGTSETADPTAQCGDVCSGEGNSNGFCGGGRTLTLYKFSGSGTPSVGTATGGTVNPSPVTIKQIKATSIRQCTVKGDPGYPANNKVVTVSKRCLPKA